MNDLHKTKKRLTSDPDGRSETEEPGARSPDGTDAGMLQMSRDTASESKVGFRLPFDAVPDAMFIADAESGVIVDANPAASRLLMRPLDEIIGLHQSQLHPAETSEFTISKFKELAEKTEVDKPQETLIVRSDGERIPVEILSKLIHVKGRPFLLGIFRDISLRKEVELALQESEARYRSVIENLRDAFYRADTQGTITMASPSAAPLLGYDSVDEILGRQIESFWEKPRDRDKMLQNMLDNNGAVTDYEVNLLKKDGSPLKASVSSTFQRDSNGLITGIEGTIRDITGRKLSEDALIESELRYRNLFDTSTDSIFIVDRSTGNFVAANAAASRLYGYSNEEFLQMNIRDISSEHEKSLDAVENGATFVPVRLHMKKDGSSFPVEIVGSYFTQGGRSFHTAFIRDITERRGTEEALEHKLSELRAVYENTPIMMCMLDRSRHVLYANNAFMKFVGRNEPEWSSSDALGGILGCLQAVEDPRGCGFGPHCGSCRLRSAIEETMRTGQSHLDVEHRTKLILEGTEQEVVLLCSVAAIRTSRNPNLLLCIDNITEEKEAENRLLIYQSQLQSLASQLISAEEKERRRIAVSLHDDIAQNLAIAKMKLGEVRDATSGPVSGQTDHVYRLIKQALTDIRAIMYELSPPILYELGFIPAVEWLAEDFQVKFNLSVAAKLDDDIVLSDEIGILLFQSIRELLYNIVKHSHADCAHVTVKSESDGISVIVEDNGIGFDASRIQRSARKKMSLGLFNIRERLSLLGGRIVVSSEPGRGTMVTIFIPIKG